MIRRTLFYLLFFFVCSFACAQDFNAGIRAGIAGTQVNGDKLSGFNKAGIIAGGFVNRKLSDHFTMQMEIVYIQKGSRKPVDEFNTFYRMRVHYIQVPLILRWHLTKKLDLTGGPSFGSLIFSQENDEYGVYLNALEFKKFEMSYNGGAIYRLSDTWSFDARYSHSITTIRPYPGPNFDFFDKGQYNVLIEFTLLYQF